MSSCRYKCPLGNCVLVEEAGALTHFYFENDAIPDGKIPVKPGTPALAEACRQLDDFFAGKLKKFTVPLAPAGTPFMKKIWKKLCEIPFGKTATYGEIAARAGNPKAARAVGLANNKNPLPVFIPCHRVVGAGGKLVGYRGGLPAKEILLRLELNAG